MLEQADLFGTALLVVGNLVLVHVHRGHRRHLHGEVVGELGELRRARHEVRLAIQLDHGRDPVTGVHVAVDETLGRRAVRLGGGLGDALFA